MKIGRQTGQVQKLRRQTTIGDKIASIVRIVVIVGIVIGLIWAQNNFVATKSYIFTSDRVPKTFVGFNIVHVSDLHNSNIGVVGAVKRADPDIIVVSGGFADDNGRFNNSVRVLERLSNIAPTFFVCGDYDDEIKSQFISSVQGAQLIEDSSITVNAPEIDESAFIDKYIGGRIVNKAEDGDEDAVQYIEYTKEKLSEDADAKLMISGLAYGKEDIGLVDLIYSIIGTDKEIFQVNVTGQVGIFDTLSNADIDIVFSGGTHGMNNIDPEYSKGTYSKNGTTLFLSGGIGNLDEFSARIFNFPEITKITLSDGTIKQENPIEKLLGYFIPDVKTRFDGDEGFKEYVYNYDGATPYDTVAP